MPPDDELRTYRLTTTAPLRDDHPPDKQRIVSERPGRARVRTGNARFDGLYAMAVDDACANSVSRISDASYAGGAQIPIEAYQTGELWTYVWTRDLSYALHLGLALFDPPRAINSLLYKTSALKPTVRGGATQQIVQDTGSGGSYPVSTDRVVWALGAHETLKCLPASERQDFLATIYPILCGTIEQDRRLVFDPGDGLYRGEQSFLDWRVQSYPDWTATHMLTIAVSKALSVNAANYILLTHAAEYSRLLGEVETGTRYTAWAGALREAVNAHFYDPSKGLYSTYLLSDDGVSDRVRAPRYDLLGTSLAVLSGLADEARAAAAVANYPTGPFGPPVVWPQEKSVPIYHNQGIWPFVTAYGIKAAQRTGHAAAVDAGVRSLVELAADNLSNMENFDFVSGSAHVKTGPRVGPQINSRRQLWSVAGYLSMVQDVVFGLETSWDGMRFRPFVTAMLRHEFFPAAASIEWHGLVYHGTQNRVRVHLPPAGSFAQGVCAVERVELNGRPVGTDFVRSGDLAASNEWEVFLTAPAAGSQDAPLLVADVSDERSYCGPVQPRWTSPGLVPDGDRLTLYYEHDDAANVTFNVYRDGLLCAEGIRRTQWTDPASGDRREVVRSYRVAAVDARSGTVSHPTPARAFRAPDQVQVIPAASLRHHGGILVDGHRIEGWGKADDELLTLPLTVNRDGRYLVRAEFSNGAGPLFTGVACAVKKLEVRAAGTGEIVAAGYVVMPQSNDWKRFDLSSAVRADLRAGTEYVLRLSEDEWCRNMSYLEINTLYSAAAGGGEASYNFVHVAALHLLFVC